ncbi:hypothetical protein ACH50O_02055 [Methylomonas sp. 2BW1-5-20]|uniref:hypothetical protein n=1 Tax=Methylomonas sp. 2BW1-5-20 TaxID=3376686 RepID=UPI00404FE493
MQTKLIPILAISTLFAANSHANAFSLSTGDPDFKIATGSRLGSTDKIEIESADDFVLTQHTQLNHATFTGLLAGATLSDVANVNVEIYRVFGKDRSIRRPAAFLTASTRLPTSSLKPANRPTTH